MLDVVLAGTPGSGKTTLLSGLVLLVGRGANPAPAAASGWQLSLRRGRHQRLLRLWDSPGFSDAIDSDPVRRRHQALALERLLAGFPFLHVVDVSRVGEVGLTAVDQSLAALGRQRGKYCLVATCMDRPWAHTGLQRLRQHVPPASVLPVCAHTGQGIGQVKAFLLGLAYPP